VEKPDLWAHVRILAGLSADLACADANAMETQYGYLDELNDEGVMGDQLGDVDASQPDLP
jgi:hypothetical protein